MRQFQGQLSRSKYLIIILALAALYLATARLGLTLALPPAGKATAVWPPSGIALAALLLFGYGVWPGIWLGSWLGNFWDFFDPANQFSWLSHLLVSSCIATGSTLQPLLGTFLLTRWVGRENPLNTARSVFLFLGVASLMCLVAASIGVTALAVTGFAQWRDYGFNWLTWWLGDTVGILVVAPLILVWSRPPRWAGETRLLLEAGLLLGLLLGVGLSVFGGWGPGGIDTSHLAYMSVPPLVWAAFRFGRHGATVALIVVSGVAIAGTAQNQGPFVRETLNASLLSLQTFLAILAVMVLALAGVLSERRRAELAQASLIEQLQQAFKEIKTLRGLIPICAWCKKVRNDVGLWQQLEAYLRDHSQAEFSHAICPECVAREKSDPALVNERDTEGAVEVAGARDAGILEDS